MQVGMGYSPNFSSSSICTCSYFIYTAALQKSRMNGAAPVKSISVQLEWYLAIAAENLPPNIQKVKLHVACQRYLVAWLDIHARDVAVSVVFLGIFLLFSHAFSLLK